MENNTNNTNKENKTKPSLPKTLSAPIIKNMISFSEMMLFINLVTDTVLAEDKNGNITYYPENLDLYFNYWLVRFYTDYPIEDKCADDELNIDVDKAYDLLMSDDFALNVFDLRHLSTQQKYIYDMINKTVENRLQIMYTQRYSLTDKALAELLNKVPALLEKLTDKTIDIKPEDLKKLNESISKFGTKSGNEKLIKTMIDMGLVERPVKKDE
mgnify:FL=1